jgi:choline-glycine betaine transporter
MVLGNNFGMKLMESGTEISMIPYEAINKHWIMPVFFIILMSMFYITSSDSQSFAMDSVISRGSNTPIVYRKILWVGLEVLFVTVLLLAGGGTTSAIQGLSFLAVPLMILFAFYATILVIRQVIINKKNNKQTK